jgi:hypothetical protein
MLLSRSSSLYELVKISVNLILLGRICGPEKVGSNSRVLKVWRFSRSFQMKERGTLAPYAAGEVINAIEHSFGSKQLSLLSSNKLPVVGRAVEHRRRTIYSPRRGILV